MVVRRGSSIGYRRSPVEVLRGPKTRIEISGHYCDESNRDCAAQLEVLQIRKRLIENGSKPHVEHSL